MKCGILTSNDLATQGRWDASYLLLYKEHQSQVEALIAKYNFDRVTLQEIAIELPLDPVIAQKVAHGSSTPRNKEWTNSLNLTELATYIVLASRNLKEQIATIRTKADERIASLTKLMEQTS